MDEAILEKIHTSSLYFLEPLDLDVLYERVVKEAVKLVQGSTGSLLLEENSTLKRVYSMTHDMTTVKTRKKGFTYTCFKNRTAFVVDIDDLAKAHPEVPYENLKSLIFIPIAYKNKSMGVLQIRSVSKENFTKKQLDILRLFGSLASMAIKKTQLYDETHQALESRDLFIAMAAHELRTPLTSVNGYIQLLKTKQNELGDSEKRWLEHLSYESLRLTNLINELLEINRIKSGQLQYIWKECSLSNIINRAIANVQFLHPDRTFVLENNLLPNHDVFVGDFDKILQTITNLLDNAAKFSPPKSEVILNAIDDKKMLKIQILDKGRGIRKKELPKIFNAFYKADEFKQGMGIGLFLAKFVINRHQGNIELKSKENKGTTVTITLPKTKI